MFHLPLPSNINVNFVSGPPGITPTRQHNNMPFERRRRKLTLMYVGSMDGKYKI